MRNGFSFNGRHSSEFGVTVKTKSRPIRPETKSFTVDIPCRDGVYDFSRSNPMGREFFYERVISVSISIQADSLIEMQNKLSALSMWLMGRGELVFDDMPYTVWEGRILDEIVYLPEHAGKCAVLDVVFRVKPFSTCAFSSEGPTLDFAVPLDTNIPIGIDAYLKGTVYGSGDIGILNFGERPVRPILDISGSADEIIITAGDKKLSFDAFGRVMVDCENQSVTDVDGDISVSGEFFELAAGVNVIHIENSNTSAINIEVKYSPEFTYGVDFNSINWGAE